MKRRSMVVGIGTLAMGSGAVFTSASISNSTSADSTLEVISVGELVAERGADTISNPNGSGPSDFDYTTDYSINDASDVPVAYVNGNTTQDGNDQLNVKVATRNSTNLKEFPHLLEVTNNGTTSANVGIGIPESGDGSGLGEGFGSSVTDGPISKADVADTYSFKTNDSASTYDLTSYAGDDVDISTNSSQSDFQTPVRYIEIPSAETLAVDLDIRLPNDTIVSDINSEATPGKSFTDNETSGVTLIQKIAFGTESA